VSVNEPNGPSGPGYGKYRFAGFTGTFHGNSVLSSFRRADTERAPHAPPACAEILKQAAAGNRILPTFDKDHGEIACRDDASSSVITAARATITAAEP
jgi:hypothetical protein